MNKRALYEDRKKKFSKLFLNIWDWNIDNSYEFNQMKNAGRLEI